MSKEKKSWTFPELLTTAPLFNSTAIQARGTFTGGVPLVTAPDQIRMYCKNCDHETTWQFAHSNLPRPAVATYSCANCPKASSTTAFALFWDVRETEEQSSGGPMGTVTIKIISGRVVKYGQHPPPSVRISKQLEKRLGAEHAEFYKTAIRLRHSNAGLGAMAYMRRVVEDTSRQLANVVIDNAVLTGFQIDEQELKRVREGRDVATTIELAKRAFSERLQPGGHNPLERLYSLASEGIHGRSDDDCVLDFDECRRLFEYFFEELPQRNEREAAFRADAGRPSRSARE